MVDHNTQPENPEFEPSQLDQDLRRALRPRSAPPGFAARVMRQIPTNAAPAPHPRRARLLPFRPGAFPPAVRLAAVASVLVVILAGTFAWQHHQRVLAGQRARQQVLVALHITHATLQQVARNVSSNQNRKELYP